MGTGKAALSAPIGITLGSSESGLMPLEGLHSCAWKLTPAGWCRPVRSGTVIGAGHPHDMAAGL